jgi:hypothetical protein
MKLKPIPVGTVFAVIMLLFIIISGLAFATKTASAASTSPNSASSDVEVRADLVPGGKSVDQLEFWQADEFEIWMEQQHEENQRLADNHDKSFYDKDANGDYYCREWTQEDVDTLYDQWHEQLVLMKEGYQFTKQIPFDDDGVISGVFGPEANDPPVSAHGATIITLPNNSTVDLGHFDTADEAKHAVEEYLSQQVEAGTLTQSEADNILIHGVVE